MPTHAETLIAKVRALGHADAEIARRIGITRGQLTNVANGRDKLSPELAALLAELCGENAQKAMACQSIENAKEPRKSMLQRALFTYAVLGVGLASQSWTDSWASSARSTERGNAVHIVGHWLGWLRRLIGRPLSPDRPVFA